LFYRDFLKNLILYLLPRYIFSAFLRSLLKFHKDFEFRVFITFSHTSANLLPGPYPVYCVRNLCSLISTTPVLMTRTCQNRVYRLSIAVDPEVPVFRVVSCFFQATHLYT